MIKYITLGIGVVLFSASVLFAQIQTTALPKPGFEDRIRKAVNDIWIIDTHEHLEMEEERLERKNIDFTYLFKHYAYDDLVSASHSMGLVSVMFGHNFSLEDRWQLFKPFFNATRNTGYMRASLLAANDLFGISDLNDETYRELTEKIRAANKPGWYKYVLKDRAKIELSIQDVGDRQFDRNFYRHVVRFDKFISVFTINEIKNIGLSYGIQVNTLEDYLTALRKAFRRGIDNHMVGVKSALAYDRILKYDNVTKEKAQAVFEQLVARDEKQGRIDFQTVKPLQDYMMHCVLDLAEEFNMPVQIHTGLHAGNGNYITNSNPTHLTNLFFEYPNVNFCLFHSAYPYGGELSVLAKNFPNVFIDMCWSDIISPSYSIRYLNEWLETVPANKIMAFGGDYMIVEGVYAHSVMARRIVAKVLIDKVASGYFSEKEAVDIARRILRENAMEIFRLKGKSRSLASLPALNRPGFLHDWWQVHNSNKGFIRNWQVIGPFDYGKGLENVCPPEKEIKLDATYIGADGPVTWQKASTEESGYLNFAKLFYAHPENNPTDLKALAYAYAKIKSPDDRQVKMTLGSNDGAKVWVNGKVVYNEHVARGAVADQVFLKVTLHKGENEILAKVENLGNNWGLYVRLVDPDQELKAE